MIIVLALVSCGYGLAGQGDRLPIHISTLAIPAFDNQTTWMRAGQQLTSAVMREFIQRTRYLVVGGEEGADAVLRGTVLGIRTVPVIFDPSTGRASTVQVELRLKVELRDLHEDKVLFTRSDYVFREEYEITGDLNSFFDERNPLLNRIAREFASTLVSAILENF